MAGDFGVVCISPHLPQVAAVLRPLAQRLTFVCTLTTCVVLKASGRNITRPGDAAAARVYEFGCSRTGRHYIAEPPEGRVQTGIV
jgi:hypothetical protein